MIVLIAFGGICAVVLVVVLTFFVADVATAMTIRTMYWWYAGHKELYKVREKKIVAPAGNTCGTEFAVVRLKDGATRRITWEWDPLGIDDPDIWEATKWRKR